jgi:hypothetical protein
VLDPARLRVPPTVDRDALLEPWGSVLPRRGGGYDYAVDASGDFRRAITRNSPVRFALVYLGRHLRSSETRGIPSLAEHHIALGRIGRSWREPGRHRDIVVAPRYGAKSTWMVILTLWALAHGHRRFALWISDSAGQAELHLATLRQELETNVLLRSDFPDLLPPPRGARGARDTQATYTARGGAVVAVRGADTRALGLKLGRSRPDLIVLDDLEPDASNYSANARRKRLDTVLHAILPMNEQAAVLWLGTVVMYDSILHAAVRSVTEPHGRDGVPEPWLGDEGFTVHHVPPVVVSENGERRSFWPERYPLDYLDSIAHTLNYALNFACRPPLPGGHHWTDKTFRRGRHPVGPLVLQVDPATTVGPRSDFSAIVVGGKILHDGITVRPGDPVLGAVSIEYAEQVRLTPAKLATRVRVLLTQNPRIRTVRVLNTGQGQTWADIFTDLPGGVRLELVADSRSSSGVKGAPSKDLKFAGLLGAYEAELVWHAEYFPELEDQLRRWPEVDHDDLGDCTAELVAHLRKIP